MRKEHSVKLHILKTLSDGGFHSGEMLGQQLGILKNLKCRLLHPVMIAHWF